MENHQFERLLHEIGESRRQTEETAAGLRELRQQIAALNGTVEAQSGSLAALNGTVEAQSGSLAALNGTVEGQGVSLVALRASVAETRRHMDVVAEGLRAEIRLVAEGVVMVDSKVDRLRGDMTAEFAETRSMIRFAYDQLDRRLPQ
jgi:chromosome segregation ATPase